MGDSYLTTISSNSDEENPSGASDPPQLRVVAEPLGPGDGLEVICRREICLEEPLTAVLLNLEEITTYVEQAP